jgi:hypothetical protein
MNKQRLIIILAVALALALAAAYLVSAVSGAAFTTFNAHVDGSGKDVCKNTAINCNIYGAKEYVWLNGGPTANGLGPDGQYFFAVLVPGGQPDPNDGGAKNLSDDFDEYTNRTFTVTDGEVSAYAGTHWLDSGQNEPGPGDPKPNDLPPYIRLFPYADTTNPGGVYILAICSLDRGYPVEPRDCKYDAFKVKKGKLEFSFYLSGMKFEDLYADGVKDNGDPGLEGWKIIISGTGPDGLPFYAEVLTSADGSWEYFSPVYTFTGSQKPVDVSVTVCEELKDGWTQSYPDGDGCHSFTFTPTGFDSFFDIDFGNWRPVDVTACKVRDLDGEPGGETVPVAGWEVSLTEEGTVTDTNQTGDDGCYTWSGLTPGIAYDVHEESRPGWEALDGVDFDFDKAKSGESFSHTFVNAVLEGCTPGFWQGGNDFGTAGGKWLWNEDNDPQWVDSGGAGYNPYIWTTGFCGFFGCTDGSDMWYYLNPELWSVNDDFHKAARSLVAAYLNASWGMNYAYTTVQLSQMWSAAVASGDFMSLHLELDAANNAYYREDGGPRCPISAGSW